MSTPSKSLEETFATNVRRFRRAHGWTQADLAARIAPYGHEMHFSTVTKLEAAQRPIRLNEADAIARIFEMPLSTLLTFGAVESDDPLRAAEVELAAARAAFQRAWKAVETAREEAERLGSEVRRCSAAVDKMRAECSGVSDGADVAKP